MCFHNLAKWEGSFFSLKVNTLNFMKVRPSSFFFSLPVAKGFARVGRSVAKNKKNRKIKIKIIDANGFPVEA